jgi:hypothetical protein
VSRNEARFARAQALGACLALGCSVGCTEQVQLGQSSVSSAAGASSPGAGGAGVDGAGAGLPLPPDGGGAEPALPPLTLDGGECVPVSCGPRPLACGDCQDNDRDGRIDAADPECLGPCDDSEAELFSGLDSQVNSSCRADCYFDQNAGYNDGCRWSYACDEQGVGPDYPPTGLEKCAYDPERDCDAELNGQSQSCRDSCLPLTPNGCDCFGCCELPAGSGAFVWLGAGDLDLARCELGSSADPSICRPCTPVPSCQNTCEPCELCVGKPTLPESCAESGSVPSCPYDWRPCDPARGLGCGRLEYCITGCCVPLPR